VQAPGAAVLPEFFNFSTDIFDRFAVECPDAPALWWVDARLACERRFSFRELRDCSLRAAAVFRGAGIAAGEPVMLLLPRVPEWWMAMLGLIRLGAVPVPCTPQLTSQDLAYRRETGGIRAVLTDRAGAGKLDGFEGPGWLVGDGDAPGWCNFSRALESAPATMTFPRTRSGDPGIMFFTSSTTGSPKMVLHTQASYGLGHAVTGKLWLDLRPGDVHWNTSDLGWAKAAWSSFFGPWHCGACVFAWDAPGRFSPGQTLDVLSAHPITTLCAPPTAFRMMVHAGLEGRSFPRLRHCVTAGEPLDAEVFSAWRNATGLSIHEGYGQTETVLLIGHCRPLGHDVVPGSLGRAVPGADIRLLDGDLREVPDGTEGEIALRTSPQRPVGLFREYWHCPGETDAQFRDGWYLTGDRAVRDAEGLYWFVGRKDDVIKSSGFRIGPYEVESALHAHPAVSDAAVVGKPDALRGQIVKAFVVLQPGHEPGDTLRHVLQQHCRQVAAPYKYPREIEFVDSLPKTASGKTQRFLLRRRDADVPPPAA
jgi:acetyl-CoA synthetase/medium-chain acyl-CoA synthetase